MITGLGKGLRKSLKLNPETSQDAMDGLGSLN